MGSGMETLQWTLGGASLETTVSPFCSSINSLIFSILFLRREGPLTASILHARVCTLRLSVNAPSMCINFQVTGNDLPLHCNKFLVIRNRIDSYG